MRGGGTSSCALTGKVGQQTSVGSSKIVTILEDELRVASPEQIICYGDTFTTCQTLTIVMEDDWKVGVHLNSAMFLRYDNGTTYNPVTLIPILQTLLSTHPKYKDSSIKAIYLVSALSSVLSKDPGTNIFFKMINNSDSMERLRQNQRKILSSEDDAADLVKSFFMQVFPDKIIEGKTKIQSLNSIQVQYGKNLNPQAYFNENNNGKTIIPNDRKKEHFFIFEDGTLEIVYEYGGIQISPIE